MAPSLTIRSHLGADHCLRISAALFDNREWPKWHRGAKALVTQKVGSIKIDDMMALQQIIKGALVETTWQVESIKSGENFDEIVLKFIEQNRNERPTARGISNYRVSVTILANGEGGVEIHSEWQSKGLARLISRNNTAFVRANAQTLLEDLCGIE